MSSQDQLDQREMKDMLDAQRRAADSARRAEILHGMELKLAELIGTDGDGGTFATTMRKVEEMEKRLDTVVLFTHRAKWTIGLLASAAGAVAAVAMVLIERLIGK